MNRSAVGGVILALVLGAAGCECGAPVGVRCASSADCPTGAICDEEFGLCVAFDSTTGDVDAGTDAAPDAGEDAGVGDGGPADASLDDAGASDSGPGDAGPSDSGPGDSGPGDAGPTDSGPADSGPADGGPTDSGPRDSGPGDAGPGDSGPTDSGPRDSGPGDAGPGDSGPTDSGPRDSGPGDAGADAGPADSGPADAGVDAGPTTCAPPCGSGFECYALACVPVAAVRITAPVANAIFGRATFNVDITGTGPGGVVSMVLRGMQNGVEVFRIAAAAGGSPNTYRAAVNTSATSIASGQLTLIAQMTYDPASARVLDSAPVVVRVDKTPPTIKVEFIYPDRVGVADVKLRAELVDRYRRIEQVEVRATIVDDPASPIGAGVLDATVQVSAPGVGPLPFGSKSGSIYSFSFPARQLAMAFGEGPIAVTVDAADTVANAASASANGQFTRLKWWHTASSAVTPAPIVGSPLVHNYAVIGGSLRLVTAVARDGLGFTITDDGWPRTGVGLGWTASFGANTSASPALAFNANVPEAIYLGFEDGRMRAINALTGVTSVTCGATKAIFSSATLGGRNSNQRLVWFGEGLLADTGSRMIQANIGAACAFGSTQGSLSGVLSSGAVRNGGFFNTPFLYYVARRSDADQRWALHLWRTASGIMGRNSMAGPNTVDGLSSPALARNFVVVGTNDQNLLIDDLDLDGNIGSSSYAVGAAVRSSPVVGGPGTGSNANWVYVSDAAGRVHGVVGALTGFSTTQRWMTATGAASTADFEATPALGQGGTVGIVYAPAPNGVLWALDGATGAVQWTYPDTTRRTPAAVLSSPALWCDGTIYYGAQDGRLYAVSSDSPAILQSPWPKFRRDNRNTGNLGTTLVEAGCQ